MAGDWIPVRVDLDEDPAVIGISGRTGIDEFAVVGRLVKLWGWAQGQTADGLIPHVSTAWLDGKVKLAGFAAAMVEVGWLESQAENVVIPKFERWLGRSAKRRLQHAREVGEKRCALPKRTKSALQNRTEENSKDPPKSPPGGALPIPELADLITAWNDHASTCGWKRCKHATKDRLKTFKTRSQDPYWRENWLSALSRAAGIGWIRGDTDGWIANIDWFLRPKTVVRLTEGSYDDHNGAANGFSGGSMGPSSRVRAERGKYADVPVIRCGEAAPEPETNGTAPAAGGPVGGQDRGKPPVDGAGPGLW